MPENILLINKLKKYFPTTERDRYVKAVDNVDLALKRGEILGVVGESGSGKSTIAYTVMGMYSPTSGQILFEGQDISCETSRRPMPVKKDLQIVFQDPGTSLNPQRNILQILELPLKVHRLADPDNTIRKVIELLEMVELSEEYLYKYPRALGGGERQLVAIARAMATGPKLMILDEPTSALDVSVQAKIVNTLIRLQSELGMSCLFITHDLSLMRNLAHRVAIMYLGKIMEVAPTQDFFERPLHPYTQMLLSSIPVISKEEETLKPDRITAHGEIPSPVDIPPGCRFHTRCTLAKDICFTQEPDAIQIGPNHSVSCHLFSED
ncbi:MAG: ABC transporter ATP-binding protein [Firmicutes bacterium]|nr:ABC transporter ATP-binding protein [Bacillota bacterium]